MLSAGHTRRRRSGLALSILAVLATGTCPGLAEPQPPSLLTDKRILVLHAFESQAPLFAQTNSGLSKALLAGGMPLESQCFESLDLRRNPDPAYRKNLLEHLRLKYGHGRFNLLVTMFPEALQFVLNEAASLFARVPILALHMPAGMSAPTDPSRRIFWQSTHLDVRRTLEIALKLVPTARRVLVVSGAHETDRRQKARAHAELKPWENRLEFRYLSELSMEATLSALAGASADSLVLLLPFTSDLAGKFYFASDVARRVGHASAAPVFGVLEAALGHGIVGGALYSFERTGAAAGRLVLEILAGSSPPPGGGESVLDTPAELMFDGRELKRWNLSVRSLPPGSIVINREYTLWEGYGSWLIVGCLVLIIQALMIMGLVIQRRERYVAEAALQESEQQLELALDAAALGDWSWDVQQDAVRFGHRLRLWLIDRSDVPVSYKDVLARIHPDDRERVTAIVQHALKSGEEFEVEYRVPLEDGATRWISAHGRCTYDKGGRPLRMSGVSQDITERKRAEVETSRLQQDLAHISRVSLLGELTASLAHELNQPLTAMASNAQAGQRYLAMPVPRLDQVREILADVAGDARRAGEIIHRLRTFLRKDAARFRRLDLNEVIREVVGLTRTDAIIRRQPITLALTPNLPAVKGDRVQLQQVLLNLVLNGMDAMADQSPAMRQLQIVTVSEAGTARVGVRDQGCGIPPDKKEDIFESFFTTKPGGMGMGLAISRSIIEAHGGRIWAENNPDRGATFWFTVPAQES